MWRVALKTLQNAHVIAATAVNVPKCWLQSFNAFNCAKINSALQESTENEWVSKNECLFQISVTV